MKTVYTLLEPPYYRILLRPVNRADKRTFTFETDKVTLALFAIDAEFLGDLFNSNSNTYSEIFNHHEKRYRRVAQQLNLTGRFKYVHVDEDYFYNEYKPIEK